jgi:hypothetical protein
MIRSLFPLHFPPLEEQEETIDIPIAAKKLAIKMESETGEPLLRRDRLKEARIHRNSSRQCEEERKPMVTDAEAKNENTVTQFGKKQLSPYIEDVAAMIVDEDLPYDELRQALDDRMHVDDSFVSETFDEQEVPEIVCEAFDQRLHEIISEPFLEQVSESVAEPVRGAPELEPALEFIANSVLYETSSCDKSESNVFESDENSTIDESGSYYSIDDSGDVKELIGEVTFTEDEIEVSIHLEETEEIGGIKDINPTNLNKVAEDDDRSEVTSVSADDNTVDTDDYDSDASWTSDSPLPELFKEFMFERLTGEISALTGKVYPADIRDASAGIGTWF